MIYMLFGVVVLVFGLFSGTLVGAAAGLASMVAHNSLIDTIHLANMNMYQMSMSFTLAALPLFVFMGEVAARSGLIMDMLNSFLILTRARLPGGILQPAIMTSTIFAACSGSSVASAAAMGTIVYPELKRNRYPEGLSLGTLAAGGSLAMLIPPSIVLILYASVTDVSIGALYLGAFIPGLIIALLFSSYVAIRIPKPSRYIAAGNHEGNLARVKPTARQKARAWLNIFVFAGLMFTVLGPLYLGVATATEVASLGSVGAILISLVYRRLSLRILKEAAESAIIIMGLAYFILPGSVTFSMALAPTGTVIGLTKFIEILGSQQITIALIFIFYMLLGMMIDTISITFLATPFVVPILTGFGFDLVWSGVVLVLLMEIGVLTPPFGVNLFVLQGSTQARFGDVARGCIPFVLMLLAVCVFLYFYPQITAWLPSMSGYSMR